MKRWSHPLLTVSLVVVAVLLTTTMLTLLLRRSKRPVASVENVSEPGVPFGLTVTGPLHARLPAPGADSGLDYPAVITAQVSLPGSLWGATERLRLVMVGDGGERHENTFRALDQPLGISISPHFSEPSRVPRLNQALIDQTVDDGQVESSFRANIALFGFPIGTRTYRAHAELDELRSNEVVVEITVGDKS